MDRYIKIGTNGEKLPLDAKDWVAVLDTSTNLMWDCYESKKEMTHASTDKHVGTLNIAGFSDWRMPTRKELFSITDDTRYNPAINTDYFDSHGGLMWTSTPYAGYSDYAWDVDFGDGNVDGCHRSYELRVRAVRAASQ